MICVRANNWLKYGCEWRKCGEVFEIEESDFDGLKDYVTRVNGFVSTVFPPEQPKVDKPAQKKRGRPKKSAE